MAAGEPDICKRVEFSACDPVDPVPIDRQTFAHYVRHGPVQPTNGFTINYQGRTFQPKWLVDSYYIFFRFTSAVLISFRDFFFVFASIISFSYLFRSLNYKINERFNGSWPNDLRGYRFNCSDVSLFLHHDVTNRKHRCNRVWISD
jgi:hypothetical protein